LIIAPKKLNQINGLGFFLGDNSRCRRTVTLAAFALKVPSKLIMVNGRSLSAHSWSFSPPELLGARTTAAFSTSGQGHTPLFD
jgi:hypothetical protein